MLKDIANLRNDLERNLKPHKTIGNFPEINKKVIAAELRIYTRQTIGLQEAKKIKINATESLSPT